MRNSTILFIVAILILGWFGTEVFTAQEICATSCISLAGFTGWEQAISIVILPVLLVLGGIAARKKENTSRPNSPPSLEK